MLNASREGNTSYQSLLNDIVALVDQIMTGGDLGFEQSIGPESFLGADLGFKSIDAVNLISEIQQKYDRTALPFEELFLRNSSEIQDIRLSELVDFLFIHLNLK
jgi:acyl carrier protein